MNKLSKLLIEVSTAGQSLVETAIFMPIILILLAGVVEVGNLLVTQNRVSTAARVATGFGANHYHMDYDWSQPPDPVTNKPVWAQEMVDAAMNNVTQTLDLDPQRWDIWTITGTITATVDPIQNTQEITFVHPMTSVHAYGTGLVVDPKNEWPDLKREVRNDIIEALENEDFNVTGLSNDGLGIIATVAYHDRSSLLGLNAFNFGPLTRVRGLNVMRINENKDNSLLAGACIIAPIAVKVNQHSLYPSNWYKSTWDGVTEPKDPYRMWPSVYPNDEVIRYPDADPPKNKDRWQYPSDPPEYTIPEETNFHSPSNFPANVPGVPLTRVDAGIGYLYRARLGRDSGNFAWLDWLAPPASNNDLGYSLYPGDYAQKYPGSPMDMDTARDDPFPDTGDKDGRLEEGEWIWGSTGNRPSKSIRDALEYYVDTGRTILLVAYDYTDNEVLVDDSDPNRGSNMDFHVVGFVLSKVIGYDLQNMGGGPGVETGGWIIFEFLGWSDDCGSS